jgi:prepilin signal peptidase PulO-like enzyme (type II secretory pathway)
MVAVITFLPMLSADALLHATLNFSFFRLLHVVTHKAIGYGDVRLALLIGLYSGSFFSSVEALAHMNIISWISAGIFASVRFLRRETSSKERIAFAPFMYLGLFVTYLTLQ